MKGLIVIVAVIAILVLVGMDIWVMEKVPEDPIQRLDCYRGNKVYSVTDRYVIVGGVENKVKGVGGKR